MCQECLINYLVTKSGIDEDDIKKLVLYGEYFKDKDAEKTKKVANKNGQGYHMELDKEKEFEMPSSIFSYKDGINRIKEIDDYLANVKVVDPAVGSGAFPLGMLNEIVKTRDTLSTYMTLEMNTFEKKAVYAPGFVGSRSTYDLKAETIKNCIFACDIEPSATDISKLRLWLSLVIEDELTDEGLDNGSFGEHSKPKQLPNLDCNIICGNSLIDNFGGVDLINESDVLKNISNGHQENIMQVGVDAMISTLISLQDKLFYTKEPFEKREIKKQIQNIYDAIIEEQLKINPALLQEYRDGQREHSKPFIIWQLYFPKVFKENGGFDITIGNPPYIGESGNKDIFRKVAETTLGKKYYMGKMDYFYFFFHKGIDITNSIGELAFITTNYYLTATGAKKLRNDLKERVYIRQLINFNEVKVFESARGQHNMITFVTKRKDVEVDCNSVICQTDGLANAEKLKSILYDNSQEICFELKQNNIFDGEECYIRQRGVVSSEVDSIDSVINKMASQEKKIGDVAEVNQGVVSGCDTVANRNIKYINPETGKIKDDGIFVFDLTNDRDTKIIGTFKEGRHLLRDFYKNSDIKRYSCSKIPSKKIIYYTSELKECDYPDIYAHILNFKELLNHRLITYNEHYHWTELHRARKEKIFEGPKIVVPYRTKTNSFAYNDIEWFCRSDCYVITEKHKETDLFFLLGLLNSKLTFLWLYHRGKRKGETLELFQTPLCEIPIIDVAENVKDEISQLAKRITEKKDINNTEDTVSEENRIDELLYDALNLSEKEINCVESFIKER